MIEDVSNTLIFEKIHPDYFPYYRSWCHDMPIIISGERDAELQRLQEILYKACEFYVTHYKEYLDIINYPDKVLEILEYSQQFPFKAGTFRPDYIIDTNGSIKLCEITSRFFGNGYFMSYFMEKAGREMAREYGLTDYRSYFDEFFDYAAGMKGSLSKLLVLKSSDKSDSIKLYVPFYEALGMETHVIEAADVEKNAAHFHNSMIVSALNQKDMLSFSMNTLKALADSGMINDFRTIFLLHDKRFFNLFYRDSFTNSFLNDEDTLFLREHAIMTAVPGSDSDMWEAARNNKDGYILKHHCLGKSEKVYAGILTGSDEWRDLFTSGDVSEMILQPFISQRVFTSPWKDCILKEYVSPSILCVDDRYFGTGLFRSSSCEVINQGNAHKIIPIITDQAYKIENYNIL